MPLTDSESSKFSEAQIVALLENESKVMQWFEFVLWYCVNGPTLLLGGVNPLASALPEFDTVPIDPPDIDAVPESPQTEIEVKALVQDVVSTAKAEYVHSEIMNVTASGIAAGERRMLYKVARTFFRGDAGASPSEFSGLGVLIPVAKRLRAADLVNGYVELTDFARLVDQHRYGEGEGQSIIIMSPRGLLNFLLAHWNAGIAVTYIRLRVLDDNGYLVWREVPTFCGIPVLIGDHVPNDVTVGTDNTWTIAYILRIDRGGVYFVTRSCDPLIEVRRQDHANQASIRYRLYMTVGLVLESRCAAGSLSYKPRSGTTDV